MKIVVQIEHRASSRRGKHEGEPSFGLCDRLSRTRDNSQRQLPTDQDYAVPTREYQTDQSSLITAPTAARSVLEQRRKQQKQTHRPRRLTRSLHIRPMHSPTAPDGGGSRIGAGGSCVTRQSWRVYLRRREDLTGSSVGLPVLCSNSRGSPWLRPLTLASPTHFG